MCIKRFSLALTLIATVIASPAYAALPTTAGWIYPTGSSSTCGYLGWLGYNSAFAGYHLAQDMCTNAQGSPIYSIAAGAVIQSRTDVGGYGANNTSGGALVARYQAADGSWFTALYGHLDNPHAVGPIAAGEIIGYTNNINPSHLHFGIHPGYDPEPTNPYRGYTPDTNVTYGFVNPLPYLSAHPAAAAGAGQLIKTASSGTVYWLQNNRRYPIVSDTVLTAMQNGGAAGWNWNQIQTVGSLPGTQGPNFLNTDSNSNGVLLRQMNTATVYLVKNGVRRGFVSAEALSWNQANWFADVIDVPASVMTSFTNGTGQNIFGVGEGAASLAIKQIYQNAYNTLMGSCGTTTWLGWPLQFATCLELPQGPVLTASPSGVSGKTGTYQEFGNETMRLGVLSSSDLGTFAVWGGILGAWQSVGYSASALGFPTSNEYAWGAFRRSDFEGGYIYWSTGGGAVIVQTAAHNPTFDINGDTNGDILLQNLNTTQVGVWLMNGTGQPLDFHMLSQAAIGSWRVVGTGDFNNDGINDILLQDANSTQVGCWTLNSSGLPVSFRLLYAGNIGSWRVVGVVDLNRDGTPDIVLQDASSNVGAWFTNQDGVITSFQRVYPNSIGTWKVVATADLNGDGIGDLVLQNAADTQVAVWLMDGTGHPSSFRFVYQSYVGSWNVVGAVDLNHDGRADLLLQDSASTQVGVWFMNASGLPYSFQLVSSSNIGPWRVNGRP